MEIQLIRNATLKINYSGYNFLIDPMLSEKHTFAPFPNSLRQEYNNPLVDLPISIKDILEDIDAVIVTHLHIDHWDETAESHIPKNIKVYVQNRQDQMEIEGKGFTNTEILSTPSVFNGIKMYKTAGSHGRGEVAIGAGEVCGIVFESKDEKKLYIAGDTVWCDEIAQEVENYTPEVIVVNGGANQFLESGPLIMDENDILDLHQAIPSARIVSVHMEAVNHWGLSRKELSSFAKQNGFDSRLSIPKDGESLSF